PAAAFLRHNLLPIHNSIGEIDTWLAEAPGKPAGLHIDTGLTRLGMPLREIGLLAGSQKLRDMPLAIVMSHLACADEQDHPLNGDQRRRFGEACAALALPATVPRSLVASAGIFLAPSFHF